MACSIYEYMIHHGYVYPNINDFTTKSTISLPNKNVYNEMSLK